jgi:hypothetical protein
MNTEPEHFRQKMVLLIISLAVCSSALAQFVDDFNHKNLAFDPRGVNGWTFYTGDGLAVMNFSQAEHGFASISVDATKDQRGIWWALIKRRVSNDMKLALLRNPEYALRIEARIRVSSAPKRVNLHLNTQRTTDFHTHLMEFDIPDTTNWHTISLTTLGFDAVPGDSVYGQLALMDWGLEKYSVDLDYFKVDIVNVDTAGPDKGVQVPYHPPIPDPSRFSQLVSVDQDCTIDPVYHNMNFNDWSVKGDTGRIVLLTVSGSQYAVMRWDLRAFAGKEVAGAGLLELTSYDVQRSPAYKDFGMVRIIEILGGDPLWNQKDVTYDTFCQGKPLNTVLNSQMIIDIDVNELRGGRNLITISQPVLQRMIDGKTFGLAIRPLGAVNASFYAMENRIANSCARLRFNLSSDSSIHVK